MNENTPQKLRNARACEACRASKSRCFFKDNEQTVCQKCEQTGYPCIIRLKARPMRSRAVRPWSSSTKPLSPRVDGSDFTLDLPSTPAPSLIKDVKDLHDHHRQVFGDEDSEIKLASTDERPRLIEHRRLNLQEAEMLLDNYRRKAVTFPFVLIPSDSTVPMLSRTSPFLLLAILTAAAAYDPPLRHQLDQEFRRILSTKVVIDGQKSLDYLQGLLVYICWYPLHSKPKSNQAFMYINLAISLVVELGLERDEIPSTDFSSIKTEGLIENGCFTHCAKRAYLGAYYVSAALSESFARPNQLEYRNLLGSNGRSFLEEEAQTDVKALVNIHRLLERISLFHIKRQAEPENPSYSLTSDLNVQIFRNELEDWRRTTPDEIRNLPHIGLVDRFTGLTIYSHELGFLLEPYRDHIQTITRTANQKHLSACLVACKAFFEYLLSIPESHYLDFGTLQWLLLVQSTLVLSRLTFLMASTRGWDSDTTRSNIPLVMYLDALCYRFQALSSTLSTASTSAPRNPDILYVFKMVLASVKKSYERRVAKIVPEILTPESDVIPVPQGHCPVLDPGLKEYWDNDAYSSYDEGSWDTGLGSTPLSSEDLAPAEHPQSTASPLYFDVWNTMTCNWAEEGI